VKQLHEKMLAWREKVGAKMPTKNTEQGEGKSKKQNRQQRKKARAAEDDD
jgi:hypothetical protein